MFEYDPSRYPNAPASPTCPPFYAAILAECARTERPTAYHSDVFLWDRGCIGEPCLWILREYGTNLAPVTFNSEQQIRQWMGHDHNPFGWIAHFHCRDPFHYYWDGIALRRITPEEAVSLMREGARQFREEQRNTRIRRAA